LAPKVPDYSLPNWMLPRAQDWCRQGDIVANWSVSNYLKYGYSRHIQYAGTDYISKAGAETVRTLDGLPLR